MQFPLYVDIHGIVTIEALNGTNIGKFKEKPEHTHWRFLNLSLAGVNRIRRGDHGRGEPPSIFYQQAGGEGS